MARKKNKYKPTQEESLLIELKNIIVKKSSSNDQKEKAQSLVRWYIANHFFTPSQIRLGKALTVKV